MWRQLAGRLFIAATICYRVMIAYMWTETCVSACIFNKRSSKVHAWNSSEIDLVNRNLPTMSNIVEKNSLRRVRKSRLGLLYAGNCQMLNVFLPLGKRGAVIIMSLSLICAFFRNNVNVKTLYMTINLVKCVDTLCQFPKKGIFKILKYGRRIVYWLFTAG